MEQDYTVNKWKVGCPNVDCRKKCVGGLKYVNVPSSLGDDSKDSPSAPKNGAYCNAIVVYEANKAVYIYSSEGVPVKVKEGE